MISQHIKDEVILIKWIDQDGNPKSLANVTSVKGVLRIGRAPNYTDRTVTGAFVVTSQPGGLIEWTISQVDGATSGNYMLHLYATRSGGELLTSLPIPLIILDAPTPPA